MLYMPEANQDMLYVNDYGYNLKQLDPQLPEGCRSFDIKDFLNNPRHSLAATFQLNQYIVKYGISQILSIRLEILIISDIHNTLMPWHTYLVQVKV